MTGTDGTMASSMPAGPVRTSDTDVDGLSIIIPAYNEAPRIGATLRAIDRYAASLAEPVELIVVNDGSADRTTEKVQEVQRSCPRVRLLASERNLGKGSSVRRGVLAAAHSHVAFIDADLSSRIEDVALLRAALRDGADVAIGSRRVAGADVQVPQGALRRIAGVAFATFVSAALLPGIEDTQCGFKAFRRQAARAIFSRQLISGFAFDVEVLWLARFLGLRIAEVPIVWRDDPRTHIRLFRDSLAMLRDVARVRWHALSGRYSRSDSVGEIIPGHSD